MNKILLKLAVVLAKYYIAHKVYRDKCDGKCLCIHCENTECPKRKDNALIEEVLQDVIDSEE